jgi:hypothetical protein
LRRPCAPDPPRLPAPLPRHKCGGLVEERQSHPIVLKGRKRWAAAGGDGECSETRQPASRSASDQGRSRQECRSMIEAPRRPAPTASAAGLPGRNAGASLAGQDADCAEHCAG